MKLKFLMKIINNDSISTFFRITKDLYGMTLDYEFKRLLIYDLKRRSLVKIVKTYLSSCKPH
jgi:hypothetical protein